MSELSKALQFGRLVEKTEDMGKFMTEGRGPESGLTVKDVDQDEFWAGVEIETEHTDDRKIAAKITLDHFAEFPKGGYYKVLKVMETFLKSVDGWPKDRRDMIIDGLGKVVEQYVLQSKGQNKREESTKTSSS